MHIEEKESMPKLSNLTIYCWNAQRWKVNQPLMAKAEQDGEQCEEEKDKSRLFMSERQRVKDTMKDFLLCFRDKIAESAQCAQLRQQATYKHN